MDPSEPIAVAGRDVIIIEHEFLFAQSVADQLADLGARIVGTAATPQRVGEIVRSRPALDLVIADLALDGENIASLIVEMVGLGAEVVLSTALSTREVPGELTSLPYLRKPYDPAVAFTARKSPSSLAYSRSGKP